MSNPAQRAASPAPVVQSSGRRLTAAVPGAGPEQVQQHHARAAVATAIAGIPVADHRRGRGVNFTRADVRGPQVFVTHPALSSVVATSDVSAEVAWPHLPGRVSPAAWDGEPGPASPVEVPA